MEHFEDVTETHRKLVRTTCDICGNEIKDYYTVGKRSYTNKVEISHEKSEFEYEASTGKWLELDVCGDCFETKIFPFLKGIGLKRDYCE